MTRTFRFWLVTIAAIAGFAATFALGEWQLGRGRQRDAVEAELAQREAMPPLGQEALLQPRAEQWLHRRVTVRGLWDPQHTVFLDNRQMHGAPGFYVVTPLKLEGSEAAILVQRGWVPRNFDHRDRLPALPLPAGVVEITGRIAPPPARLYEFKSEEHGPIRQNLDLAAFRGETGLKLLDVSVLQAGRASDGLVRDWPRPASGSEKNYGYAFQWWAMSAVIAILYVWFQFVAPYRKARLAR